MFGTITKYTIDQIQSYEHNFTSMRNSVWVVLEFITKHHNSYVCILMEATIDGWILGLNIQIILYTNLIIKLFKIAKN